jgi:hypothetical protein
VFVGDGEKKLYGIDPPVTCTVKVLQSYLTI